MQSITFAIGADDTTSSDRREKIGYENKLNIDNHWNAFFVLYDKTSRVPHLITVVGDNNEITDGTINDSEVFAALKLCTIAHCKKEFKAHKIVPVSSASIPDTPYLCLHNGYPCMHLY